MTSHKEGIEPSPLPDRRAADHQKLPAAQGLSSQWGSAADYSVLGLARASETKEKVADEIENTRPCEISLSVHSRRARQRVLGAGG